MSDIQKNTYGVTASTLEECLIEDISYYYENLPIRVNIHPLRFPTLNSTFYLNVQSEERILFSFFCPFSVTPCNHSTVTTRQYHTLNDSSHYPFIRDRVLRELEKFMELDDEDDE